MNAEINYDIINDASELRRLILENPELPIAVMAGEEANNGDYGYMYCSSVYAEVAEILNCETPYSDCVYQDRDDLLEAIADEVYWEFRDNGKELDEEKMNEEIRSRAQKYEPYWKKVILVSVNN